MRFAVTATDRYLGVVQALVERGWTPLKVFTTEVDNRLHHHAAVIDYARHLNLEVQISRLTADNLRQLAQDGCEALVVASYRWRIPEWRGQLPYAVNFHPSPLPHGRGPYPAPLAILEQATHWGVSCHKLEATFDSGDVLRTVTFAVDPLEEHDGLDLKIQLAARRLALDVAGNFHDDWNSATPQSGGSYQGFWTDAERSLDFSQNVEQLLRRVRAFGPLECIAQVGRLRMFVRRAVGWVESHGHAPGSVVHTNQLAMIVAVPDGFIGLTQWNVIAPGSLLGTPAAR